MNLTYSFKVAEKKITSSRFIRANDTKTMLTKEEAIDKGSLPLDVLKGLDCVIVT